MTAFRRIATHVVAALSAATLVGLAIAAPAVADPTPYPSGSGSGTATSSASPTSGGGQGGIPSGYVELVAGGTYRLGENVYVVLNLPAGHVAELEIHSAVVKLGTVTGNSSGQYTYSFTIPSSLSIGEHHFIATDTTVDKQIADIPFTIAGNSSSGSGGGTANTGVAVAGIGLVGLLLIGGGAALLYTGRRRRSSHA